MSASDKRPAILVVDDVPANIRILADFLGEDHDIHVATRGAEAIDIARRVLPDIILLDVVMPEVDGYAVCRRLKADPATRDIPVIFVTARFAPEDEAHGLSLGAVDYIVKPASRAVVRARVKNHLELRSAREALARQNEELKEAARLREDVDRIMRHDLKGPLTGIIGLPQLILDEGGLSEGQELYVRLIEESGFKMLSMINLSLGLFRMERGTYSLQAEPVDIVGMLQRLFLEFSPLCAAKKLTVALSRDGCEVAVGETVEVVGERLLLYTMFANCLKNALEASPRGGEVLIDLRQGDLVTVAMTNQGVVPLGIRERFFGKYVTEGKNDGTGLGAYSTRLIAETHGGKAAMATSDEAGTTTLTLALPCVPAS